MLAVCLTSSVWSGVILATKIHWKQNIHWINILWVRNQCYWLCPLQRMARLMEAWAGKVTVDGNVLAERMSHMFSRWLITTLLNDGHLEAGILLISGPDFKVAQKYLKYCSGN